jgi:hypothetical protein
MERISNKHRDFPARFSKSWRSRAPSIAKASSATSLRKYLLRSALPKDVEVLPAEHKGDGFIRSLH